MTADAERCSFHADMIVSTRGGGWSRIANVRCVRPTGHHQLRGEERDHEFISQEHTFGVSRERGRYVTRR